MALISFTAGTKIVSADMNTNFANITNGSEVANVAWTAYTPTVYKHNGSTVITPTISNSRYIKIGRMIIWQLSMSIIVDPVGATVKFTLPVSSISSWVGQICGVNYNIGTGLAANTGRYGISSATLGYCENATSTTLPTAGDFQVNGLMIYESAS